MNWVPKDKGPPRKPSDQQKVKDFFRRHRQQLPPAGRPSANSKETVLEPRTLPEAPSNSGTSPVSLCSERNSRSRSSSMHRESRSPLEKHGDSSSGNLRGSRETQPIRLEDMDIKKLAKTVRATRKPVSTDLVHLEMIKRMFAYQPKQPTPPRSPSPSANEAERSRFEDLMDVDDQIGLFDGVSETSFASADEERGRVSRISSNGSSNAFRFEPFALTFTKHEESSSRTEQFRPVSSSLQNDEPPGMETVQSRTGSFYRDLTVLSSYGTNKPAFGTLQFK